MTDWQHYCGQGLDSSLTSYHQSSLTNKKPRNLTWLKIINSQSTIRTDKKWNVLKKQEVLLPFIQAHKWKCPGWRTVYTNNTVHISLYPVRAFFLLLPSCVRSVSSRSMVALPSSSFLKVWQLHNFKSRWLSGVTLLQNTKQHEHTLFTNWASYSHTIY